jgi:hypothetical protein
MDNQAQPPSGNLKQLAVAKFGKLSDAENLLLENIPSGNLAVCGPNNDDTDRANDPKDADTWGPDRQIRAALLESLCTHEQARKHVQPRGIQLYGADIVGPLDLSFANIPFQLMLNNCRLREDIDLRRAEVSELDLQDSLVQGILADGIVVKNNVFLRDGFAANGEVGLSNAQIGGDLDCSGGTFTNKGHDALRADGIKVKGSVDLSDGFSSNGEVRLLIAQIGGQLRCSGGTFTNKGGYALNADGINVKGNVFLSRLKNAEGRSTPFSAEGEVSLNLAQIDGQLACSGGIFSNPGGYALGAQRAVVKGSVFLRLGFSVDGRVDLEGAQIGGDFVCNSGDFQKAILDLTDASASTLYDSGLIVPVDPDRTVWPEAGKLFLDGFTYGRISSRGNINVDKRLGWLALQPQRPFHPGPYLQLAKILRESGDDEGSKQVLIEMESDEASTKADCRLWLRSSTSAPVGCGAEHAGMDHLPQKLSGGRNGPDRQGGLRGIQKDGTRAPSAISFLRSADLFGGEFLTIGQAGTGGQVATRSGTASGKE